MRFNRISSLLIIVLFTAVFAQAQVDPPQRGNRGQRPEQQQQQQPQTTAPAAAGQQRPIPEEKSSVTHHGLRIGGQQINYTATAATYNIKADDTKSYLLFCVVYKR
jgi:hypothetical protein